MLRAFGAPELVLLPHSIRIQRPELGSSGTETDTQRLGQNRRALGEKYLTLTVTLINVNPTFLDMQHSYLVSKH